MTWAAHMLANGRALAEDGELAKHIVRDLREMAARLEAGDGPVVDPEALDFDVLIVALPAGGGPAWQHGVLMPYLGPQAPRSTRVLLRCPECDRGDSIAASDYDRPECGGVWCEGSGEHVHRPAVMEEAGRR